MEHILLDNYLSRSQIREYLGYILEHGVDDIIESPDGVVITEPMHIRIGSSVNSVKIFHVARHLGEDSWLTQLGISFVSDDSKPELPEGTAIIGVFYMSKNGRDYSGDADMFGQRSVQGDIGSVTWVDAKDWETSSLGKTTSGTNYRMFVFWSLEFITDANA